MAHIVPMAHKTSTDALPAFKECFKKMGFPMSIYSDNDRAIQAEVKEFFDKEGITRIVTLTHANVVERFIRTMKNIIYDRIRFDSGRWTMKSKALVKYKTQSIHQQR